MNLLVRSAKIIDPNAKYHLQTKDLLIENGVIVKISSSIKNPDKMPEFKAENLHVSPGWVDMQANFGEPGYEPKETIESGLQCAIAGGVTNVLLMPETNPVNDSVSVTDFILKKSFTSPVNLMPAGAISKGMLGAELSEMFDMNQAGVSAFSDYKKGLKNSKLLQLALQYSKSMNALILQQPFDSNLTGNTRVNEGLVSVRLGLKGNPVLSEVLGLIRDIKIAEYCEAPIHFSIISSAEGAEIVGEARKRNALITAGTSPAYLYFSDEHVQTFDSVHKVFPPYRTHQDKAALIKALKKGIIEVICSDHSPQDDEHKSLEFEYAAFGIIGLETLFAASNTALRNHISIVDIIAKISGNPRRILNLNAATIEQGNQADLTFFDPDLEWEFTESHVKSKSKNTPFIGHKFTGKALGIYNKKKFVTC
jgi:dihydroorotase